MRDSKKMKNSAARWIIKSERRPLPLNRLPLLLLLCVARGLEFVKNFGESSVPWFRINTFSNVSTVPTLGMSYSSGRIEPDGLSVTFRETPFYLEI